MVSPFYQSVVFNTSSTLMLSFRFLIAVLIALLVNMQLINSIIGLSLLSTLLTLLISRLLLNTGNSTHTNYKGWMTSMLLLLGNVLPSVHYYMQYLLIILNVLYIVLQDLCLCLFLIVTCNCFFSFFYFST